MSLMWLLAGIRSGGSYRRVSSSKDSSFAFSLTGRHYTEWRNRVTIARLKDLFPKEILRDLIYVADSSFVTEDNLKEAAKDNIKFVSRVPATFSLVKVLIGKAWEDGNWASMDSFSSQKKASHYWACEYPYEIARRTYRFIVAPATPSYAHKKQSPWFLYHPEG